MLNPLQRIPPHRICAGFLPKADRQLLLDWTLANEALFLPSRLGHGRTLDLDVRNSLSWRGEAPEKSAIRLQVRSGNVGEPDETWSAWSVEQTDPERSTAQAPPGRFVQYRARLSTGDPKQTPELRGVSLSYRSTNLPPEINKLETPDVSTADGAARQNRLNIRWDVSDPNDDELNYTVQVRKEGWPSWIDLNESPITEKTYAWDSTAFPMLTGTLITAAHKSMDEIMKICREV